MSFDQVFSNEQIKTIFPKLSEVLKKPDVLTITANSTKQEEIHDIVIIELKRAGKLITPAEAELQLLSYADYAQDGFKENRPRIWLYAYLDLNEENLRYLIKLKRYNTIHISGSDPICYQYHESVNAIINFLSYKSVIADAEQRNKTFIEVIQNGFNDTLSQISNIDKPTA